MQCLDEQTIQRFVDGSLSDSVESHCVRHLANCTNCESAVAAQQAEQDLFLQLRDARGAVTAPGSSAPTLPAGYELIDEISRGGQGTVYRARQLSTQREVAVKVLLKGAAASTKERARFDREIEIAASLHHPNIVEVYDSGELNGVCYYVMELVEGVPLDQYAGAGTLDVESAVRLFLKVCDAVECAHRRGVIHRDLKPGNILVNSEGEPRVLDFGLAQVSGSAAHHLTSAGDFLGTLAYASPEQVGGRGHVDVRTDVYSLGVILFELLTGQMPYDVTGTVLQTIRSIEGHAPRRPSELRSGVSSDLETTVLKALSKDPDRRYQSVTDFRQDVCCALEGEPIAARRDSSWYVLRMTLRKYRLAFSAASIVVVTLIVALVVSIRFWQDAVRDRNLASAASAAAKSAQAEESRQRRIANRQRDAAEFQSYVANIAATIGALDRADVVEAAFRLSATPKKHRNWEFWQLSAELDASRRQFSFADEPFGRTAFARACDLAALIRADQTVLVMNPQDGTRVAEPDVPGITVCAFAPDGEHLALGNSGGEVVIWSLNSNAAVRRLQSPVQHTQHLGYSGDGHWLAIAAVEPGKSESVVSLVNIATGEVVSETRQEPWLVNDVAVSPDGSLFATASFNGVVVRKADGSELHRLPDSSDGEQCVAFSADGQWLASGGRNNEAYVWNVSTGARVASLRGHSASIESVAFDPSGQVVCTGSRDKTIRLWRSSDGEPLAVRAGHYGQVIAVGISDTEVVSAGRDRMVRLWDGPDQLRRDLLIGHTAKVADVAIEPRGRYLASASWDGSVRLWRLRTGKAVGRLHAHTAPVQSVSYSHDGKWLASASWDGSVCIWDAKKRELHTRLLEHTDSARVHDAHFSHRGDVLISGGSDDVLRLYSVPDFEPLAQLTGHDDHIHTVTITPDDRYVISAGHKSVRVWDLVARTQVSQMDRVIRADDFSLAVHPDGNRIAAGNRNAIAIWELKSGRKLTELKAHSDEIHSVMFSPDGSRLFSASFDNQVLIWDTEAGQVVGRLHSYPSHANSITFGRGTEVLAAGLDNGVIKLWRTLTRDGGQ